MVSLPLPTSQHSGTLCDFKQAKDPHTLFHETEPKLCFVLLQAMQLKQTCPATELYQHMAAGPSTTCTQLV